jgi:hypothetical protein
MPLDPDCVITESIGHEERAVRALEDMAEALTSAVKLGQAWFDKLYPIKPAREAIVTHVKTEEERLRESQGNTGESIDEWAELDEPELGPREKALISKKK